MSERTLAQRDVDLAIQCSQTQNAHRREEYFNHKAQELREKLRQEMQRGSLPDFKIRGELNQEQRELQESVVLGLTREQMLLRDSAVAVALRQELADKSIQGDRLRQEV